MNKYEEPEGIKNVEVNTNKKRFSNEHRAQISREQIKNSPDYEKVTERDWTSIMGNKLLNRRKKS